MSNKTESRTNMSNKPKTTEQPTIICGNNNCVNYPPDKFSYPVCVQCWYGNKEAKGIKYETRDSNCAKCKSKIQQETAQKIKAGLEEIGTIATGVFLTKKEWYKFWEEKYGVE